MAAKTASEILNGACLEPITGIYDKARCYISLIDFVVCWKVIHIVALSAERSLLNIHGPRLAELQKMLLERSLNTDKSIMEAIRRIVRLWWMENVPLFEACLVALSIHVIALPVIWFVGWALPWPKTPIFTTVVEYDLSNYLRTGKPEKILQYADPDLNK